MFEIVPSDVIKMLLVEVQNKKNKKITSLKKYF
jgi:hypothetical protein